MWDLCMDLVSLVFICPWSVQVRCEHVCMWIGIGLYDVLGEANKMLVIGHVSTLIGLLFG